MLAAIVKRRRFVVLQVAVNTCRVAVLVAIRRWRNTFNGLGRAALSHPQLSPVAYLLHGGSDVDFIRAFGFNRQAFFRLADVCKEADDNWAHVNRYGLDWSVIRCTCGSLSLGCFLRLYKCRCLSHQEFGHP